MSIKNPSYNSQALERINDGKDCSWDNISLYDYTLFLTEWDIPPWSWGNRVLIAGNIIYDEHTLEAKEAVVYHLWFSKELTAAFVLRRKFNKDVVAHDNTVIDLEKVYGRGNTEPWKGLTFRDMQSTYRSGMWKGGHT
jgi:hypothetical protein